MATLAGDDDDDDGRDEHGGYVNGPVIRDRSTLAAARPVLFAHGRRGPRAWSP
jgi:hypothetical protein